MWALDKQQSLDLLNNKTETEWEMVVPGVQEMPLLSGNILTASSSHRAFHLGESFKRFVKGMTECVRWEWLIWWWKSMIKNSVVECGEWSAHVCLISSLTWREDSMWVRCSWLDLSCSVLSAPPRAVDVDNNPRQPLVGSGMSTRLTSEQLISQYQIDKCFLANNQCE